MKNYEYFFNGVQGETEAETKKNLEKIDRFDDSGVEQAGEFKIAQIARF